MLIEEMREIATLYRDEYDRLQIASILQEAVNITKDKDANGVISWPLHLNTLYDKIRIAREKLNPLLSRQSVLPLFGENPEFYRLLPKDILMQLYEMLDIDPDVTVPSSQIERLRRRAHSASVSMSDFLGITAALGFQGIGNNEDAVTLRISMPVTSARKNLAGVIRLQKDFEDYFDSFAQFTTGEAYQPTVDHISMSNLTIFLEYTKDISTLLQYWSIMMDAANKTIELYKSISGLRNLKSDLIEQIRQEERRKIMHELESSIDEIDARKIPNGSMRPQFVQSSRVVSELIAHGLTLEVSIRSEHGWRLVVEEADEAEGRANAQKRLASHNEQQLRISRIDEEPVLLPRPD